MAVIGSAYGLPFTTGVAGETWTTVNTYINGTAVVWTLAVADLTGGKYLATITPSQAGSYAGFLNGSASGELPVNFDVQTAAQADPAAALGSGRVTVVSPVSLGGNAEMVQGNDVVLPWSTTGESDWPVLTGADIWFLARPRPIDSPNPRSGPAIVVAGTVDVATGATKQVSVALASSDTVNTFGLYDFDVTAVLADGDIRTLVKAILTIKPRAGVIP